MQDAHEQGVESSVLKAIQNLLVNLIHSCMFIHLYKHINKCLYKSDVDSILLLVVTKGTRP